MLVIHRETRIFSDFKTIMVYPDTYVANAVIRQRLTESQHQSHRAVSPDIEGRLGSLEEM